VTLSWQIPTSDAYSSILLHLPFVKLVAGDLLKLLPVFVEPLEVLTGDVAHPRCRRGRVAAELWRDMDEAGACL